MHKHAKGHAHFHDHSPLEHVIAARKKGHIASDEIHGAEMPGHISAFADTAKETSLILVLFWSLLSAFQMPAREIHWILVLFAAGWLIWKTGRSALLGYARLERMHRVIEEERWEIEHHRPQEKEELRALYQAKGFSGRLLDEAVEILMADDNRLLQVMLQEELGFRLESEEHPLKQALGACLGALASSVVLAIALFTLPPIGTLIAAGCLIGLTAGFAARRERNRATPAVIWNLACALLALIIAACLTQFLRLP